MRRFSQDCLSVRAGVVEAIEAERDVKFWHCPCERQIAHVRLDEVLVPPERDRWLSTHVEQQCDRELCCPLVSGPPVEPVTVILHIS